MFCHNTCTYQRVRSDWYGLGGDYVDMLPATWDTTQSPDKGNPSLIDRIDASISWLCPQEGCRWLQVAVVGTALPRGGPGLTLSAEMRAWRTSPTAGADKQHLAFVARGRLQGGACCELCVQERQRKRLPLLKGVGPRHRLLTPQPCLRCPSVVTTTVVMSLSEAEAKRFFERGPDL